MTLGLTVPVLASLGFAEHYLLGGDYFISGVALALVVYAFLAGVRAGDGWRLWAVALLLGLVTANRATTVPVLALVAAVLFADGRLRPSLRPLGLSVVANLALWVPWWLSGTAEYPPLVRIDLLGPPMARALALVILLVALVWIAAGRWLRPAAGSPSDRLAGEGWLLTLSGAPTII